MAELLRDTRRYADYLRLLEERWNAYQATGHWTEERDWAQAAYYRAQQEFECFTAELGTRLTWMDIDRMDRIAYRTVYGGVS